MAAFLPPPPQNDVRDSRFECLSIRQNILSEKLIGLEADIRAIKSRWKLFLSTYVVINSDHFFILWEYISETKMYKETLNKCIRELELYAMDIKAYVLDHHKENQKEVLKVIGKLHWYAGHLDSMLSNTARSLDHQQRVSLYNKRQNAAMALAALEVYHPHAKVHVTASTEYMTKSYELVKELIEWYGNNVQTHELYRTILRNPTRIVNENTIDLRTAIGDLFTNMETPLIDANRYMCQNFDPLVELIIQKQITIHEHLSDITRLLNRIPA